VGGGAAGNCAASKITQLRTTIPGIDSVTNVDAASGGQDAQQGHVSQRAALASLGDRDRAVCVDDYAAPALRAAPQVVRATALDAASTTAAKPDALQQGGVVGVAILPYGTARAAAVCRVAARCQAFSRCAPCRRRRAGAVRTQLSAGKRHRRACA
jgi:hypothetical protein